MHHWRWMSWALCLALGGPALAKVKVVATVPDLGAIAREVGGEDVEVRTLARSTQDPHYVDARPNLVLELSRAKLLVLNGLELETGWLPALLTASRNPGVQPGSAGYLDASTLVSPKEVPKEKVDRSMGDIHPGGNPHFTKDPRNGALIARGLGARLSQLDPDRADGYARRAEALAAALEAKAQQWQQALAPFTGTQVVGYHKSWVYFTDFAGLVQVAFIEPKPGLPPSSGHVAKLLALLRSRKVPLILQEEWYPAATSELLAQKSGARLVRVPGQTRESERYLDHLEQMVKKTLAALQEPKPAN
jgi:zinc/manganese transport system substrate-binding protein